MATKSEREVADIVEQLSEAYAAPADVADMMPMMQAVLEDLSRLMSRSFSLSVRDLLALGDTPAGHAELKSLWDEAGRLVVALEAMQTLALAAVQRLGIIVSASDNEGDEDEGQALN